MNFIDSSMYGLLSGLAVRRPDAPAYLDDTLTLTWQQAFERARNVAVFLFDKGVRAGDPVLVFMPRCIDTPILSTALRALGAVVVLLAPEADNPKDRADLSASYHNPWFLSVRLEDLRWTLDRNGISEEFSSDTAVSREDTVPDLRMQTIEGEPSFIIYTAGSTGQNKGVVLTERAMINQAYHQGIATDVRDDDRCLCVFPMHHIAGFVVVNLSLTSGCSFFFASTRYPEYVVRCIDRYHCTRLESVPTLFMMLSDTARKTGADISCLRLGITVGAACSPEQFLTIEDAMNFRLYPSYGMTEMAPCICYPDVDASLAVRSRSVGKFAPGVDGVLKTLSGEVVSEPFCEGEVCVRGYPLMLGYREEDGSLSLPLDPDGYLHTGDLGYRDKEGNIYLTGRCKDIIIRGGENISCSRVTASVTGIPGVTDAVALGISDSKYGEAVGILAVSDTLDRDGLLSACREVLRPCEMPASLVITDAIPVNSTGKPDRKVIRRLLEDAAAKREA